MSHSLRFPSRLLAVLGSTVTMIVLAATTAAALVPPPDPAGMGHRVPAPATEVAFSQAGLVLVAIIATAVVALAVAGTFARRAGRTNAARQARPAAPTAR